MTYHAHALPRGNEGRDTKHEKTGREHPPTSTSVAQSDQNSGNDTTDNASNTEATGEDDARPVAVANGPANEVGMGLVTERPLDRVEDGAERSGVGGVGESVQQVASLFG